VSGDHVDLAGDASGMTARLVHTAARLADADLGPYALVGGLAVMCRLVAVHRATQDIDTVTETTVPTAVEVITSSIGHVDPTNPNRAIVDGIRVDVIDTETFVGDDLHGIAATDRLFVVSHRWALDSATRIELVAGDAAASIRVATPAALVAMKAGAVFGGRSRQPRKRASDLYDIYRLVLEYDRRGNIAEALSKAPHELGRMVGRALDERVGGEPERAARWLFDGGPEMSTVTADDLRDVIGPLVDRLRR